MASGSGRVWTGPTGRYHGNVLKRKGEDINPVMKYFKKEKDGYLTCQIVISHTEKDEEIKCQTDIKVKDVGEKGKGEF